MAQMSAHRIVRGLVQRLLLLAGVLGTVGVTAWLSGCQRWVEAQVFVWPTPEHAPTPAGFEDVWFASSDDVRLHGWWLPARGVGDLTAAPTVLHVHGNAGNVESHLAFCEWIADAGFNVMLFDYRRYGRSGPGPRRPARRELIADANAALDAVLARADVDPDRLVVYGFSMGGAVSLAGLTDRTEPAGFIAAAPFSSWGGVAKDHAGLLGSLLIPEGPEPVDGLLGVRGRPLMIVHGADDRVVPVRHLGVFQAAALAGGVPLDIHLEPSAGHNDLLTSFPQTRAVIIDFLNAAVGSR